MDASHVSPAATQGRRLLVVAVALVLMALATGCSSGSSKPDASTTWADGVCSSVSTWKTSVTDAVTSVTKNGVSKDSLQSAADQAKKATDTLQSDIKKLGKPDTKAGQQAQDTATQLSDSLSTDTQNITKAINGASGIGGMVSAAATISATLVSMKTQVQTAVNSIKALDPAGELQKAFSDSQSCQALVSGTPTSK